MLARPIEDQKRGDHVAGAVIVNAVLALTVLIWTPDGVLTLLRAIPCKLRCRSTERAGIWYFGVALGR
ncbi:MAG: hypothetical protein ACLT0Y_05760 [Christensenellales bacterium]